MTPDPTPWPIIVGGFLQVGAVGATCIALFFLYWKSLQIFRKELQLERALRQAMWQQALKEAKAAHQELLASLGAERDRREIAVKDISSMLRDNKELLQRLLDKRESG